MPPHTSAHDAMALAQAIRDKTLTAREALLAALARAEANVHLGAIRFMDADRALAAADALDRLLRRDPGRAAAMPFFGIPFLMKDLGAAAAGFPVTCGSRLLADVPPPVESAELARRFLAAGLVPFGVTTVPEFGLSLACEPMAGPLARNPLDPALTPGGSSGGAGAAVAAGIVALAHATDAGGSTRVPAACCGLVGLKPTRGAVPGGPGFGNHLSGIAAELVVSRSLRDTAAALDAVAGHAEGPEPDPDLGGSLLSRMDDIVAPLRVGVCLGTDEVAADRRAAVEHAADVLGRHGHALVPLAAERLAPLNAASALVFDRVISVNLARNLGRCSAEDLALLEPLTRAALDRGRRIDGVALQEALAAGVAVSHAMWGLFGEVDVLLTPMLASAPLPIGSFPSGHEDVDLHLRRMHGFAPYAALANVAGTPAVCVPHGLDARGLPLAVQLVGPMGRDSLLLRLARQLEDEAPWTFAAGIAGL